MNNYQLLELTHQECTIPLKIEKLIGKLNELNHLGIMQINAASYS